MAWVAKGVISGKIYSKKFNSIYECQLYIDKYLLNEIILTNELNYELQLFIKKHNYIEKLNSFYNTNYINIDLTNENIFKKVYYACSLVYNNPIRCYNIIQNRFANSFDF